MPTITEALAEIKTINKRLEKKRQFIIQHLARQDGVRDPLEKQGGSNKLIAEERQAIADLEYNIVNLRRRIADANNSNSITIGGVSRTISDWLIWRREVLPSHRAFLNNLQTGLSQIREQARRSGNLVVPSSEAAEKNSDIVVNIDELKLAKDLETLEEIVGTLDGQLSLKNATVLI